MSDALQALEHQMLIEEVDIAGQSVVGENIQSLEVPNKSFPAWKLEYKDYDGIRVLVAAGVPVLIRGRKLTPIVEDTEVYIEEE
jgi:hypothetical protein